MGYNAPRNRNKITDSSPPEPPSQKVLLISKAWDSSKLDKYVESRDLRGLSKIWTKVTASALQGTAKVSYSRTEISGSCPSTYKCRQLIALSTRPCSNNSGECIFACLLYIIRQICMSVQSIKLHSYVFFTPSSVNEYLHPRMRDHKGNQICLFHHKKWKKILKGNANLYNWHTCIHGPTTLVYYKKACFCIFVEFTLIIMDHKQIKV